MLCSRQRNLLAENVSLMLHSLEKQRVNIMFQQVEQNEKNLYFSCRHLVELLEKIKNLHSAAITNLFLDSRFGMFKQKIFNFPPTETGGVEIVWDWLAGIHSVSAHIFYHPFNWFYTQDTSEKWKCKNYIFHRKSFSKSTSVSSANRWGYKWGNAFSV